MGEKRFDLITTLERFGKIVNILQQINILNFSTTGLIFSAIVFILCKKVSRGRSLILVCLKIAWNIKQVAPFILKRPKSAYSPILKRPKSR